MAYNSYTSANDSHVELFFYAALLVVVLLGGWAWNAGVCSNLQDSLQRPTRYEVLGGGCLVKAEHGWVPLKNWRSVD